MISVAQAQERIKAQIKPLPQVTVPFEKASGSILAQEIMAAHDQPRFTNSAMDGFAVRAGDLAGASPDNPLSLDQVGTISAGQSQLNDLQSGQCMQIMTGAPLPPGADAVVKVEDTSGFDSQPVRFFHAPTKGQYLRLQGEEVQAGEVLLQPGRAIGPGELGLIAGCGVAQVDIFSSPKVAVFCTGDELVEPGNPLEDNKIYNANLSMLLDVVRRSGAGVVASGTLRDNRAELQETLASSLKACHVLLVSGGVSMGRRDYVRTALMEAGVEEHIWKVAQKPGKPLFFGVSDEVLVFGLPGNPVSSFVVFMEYVWPALRALQGEKDGQRVLVRLAAPFTPEKHKHRFLFGQVWVEDGQLVTRPTTRLGSHMLTSAINSQAILSVPPGEQTIAEGGAIHARLLPWAAAMLKAAS